MNKLILKILKDLYESNIDLIKTNKLIFVKINN